MKYGLANYIKVMCCPECGYYSSTDEDNMPDNQDFMFRTDDNGKDYVECPCGCKFIEE